MQTPIIPKPTGRVRWDPRIAGHVERPPSVWIPIGALLTDNDAADIIKAIRKVHRAHA